MLFTGTRDQRRRVDRDLCLQIKRTNLSSQRSLFTRWTFCYSLFVPTVMFFTHVCATEKEKKLTFDLKKEVSGDFCKALLLLAEVYQRLMFHHRWQTCLHAADEIFLLLPGQTGGERRSRPGDGKRRRQGAGRANRKWLILGLSAF